jgi:WD40 repeat protein
VGWGRPPGVGSYDTTVRLWHPQNGTETACLDGHTDMVTALCVLSDRRLALGSGDTTIRMWDLRSGAETTRLEVNAPVFSFAILGDRGVIAGDSTGRLHWLEIIG